MEFRFSDQACWIDEADAFQFIGIALYVVTSGYLRIVKHDHDGERYVHRIIMKAKPGEYVDHINGNKLDNRRRNLRICTQSENVMNARKRSDCNSGTTGVSWDRTRLKWRPQISAQGKVRCLGRYDSFDEALQVRKAAEVTYHGQFAASLGVRANEQS